MRSLFITALLFSTTAVAGSYHCTLDDCLLANHLHQLEAPPVDGYAWMVHDLALARQAVRDGDHSRAGQIATNLQFTLERQGARIVEADGEAFVKALSEATSDILEATGFRD